MCSAESRVDARHVLLDVARRSIETGLRDGQPLAVDPMAFAPELRETLATFVTLLAAGALRGCVGGLEACRPLVSEVAHSAFAAAFRDPRFSPLETAEFSELDIHISILSPLEPLPVADEADLCRRLRPGTDGLLLRGDGHQGTFLPSVWENLCEPEDFVEALKKKAGLPARQWSSRWEVFRYTVESVEDPHA